MVCLLSSVHALPLQLQNPTKTGSLLTFFLTAPMLALSFMCGVKHLDHQVYMQAVAVTNAALNDLAVCMLNDENIDFSYKAFLENVNLRAYITRFVFYYAIIQQCFQHVSLCEMHTNYLKDRYLPSCFPEIYFLSAHSSHAMEIVNRLITQVTTLLNLNLKNAQVEDTN